MAKRLRGETWSKEDVKKHQILKKKLDAHKKNLKELTKKLESHIQNLTKLKKGANKKLAVWHYGPRCNQ
jgi:hypothetical protein